MYKYIEIVAYKKDDYFNDSEIIRRFDVTGRSESYIDKADNGLNRNLDHEKYYTRISEYEVIADEDQL